MVLWHCWGCVCSCCVAWFCGWMVVLPYDAQAHELDKGCANRYLGIKMNMKLGHQVFRYFGNQVIRYLGDQVVRTLGNQAVRKLGNQLVRTLGNQLALSHEAKPDEQGERGAQQEVGESTGQPAPRHQSPGGHMS